MLRAALILLVLSPNLLWAAPVKVAVLPIDGEALSVAERLTLTDQVRRTSLTFLVPSADYRILTRENLEEMLPPGKTMADCLGECAVQTAQEMKVDYVVTGKIVAVEGQLRLNIGVYATTTAAPLASVTSGGSNVGALEVDLNTRLRGIFQAVVDDVGGRAARGQGIGDIVSARFQSEPAGATVTVDGRTLCVTPCEEELEVGRYRVSMAMVGYVSKEVNEQLLGSKTIMMRLEKDEGGMEIRSKPRKMTIFINGKEVGETPKRFTRSPKLYRVQVGREACAVPHTQNVSVARGRTIDVDFKPAVHPAGVFLKLLDATGNHVRATVYVDGEILGETFEALQLPLCTKSVTVRAHGHPQKIPVTLTRNEVKTLKVKWSGPSIFGTTP